jgi:hypothetical protein
MSDHGVGTDRVVSLVKTSVNDHRTRALDLTAAIRHAAEAETAGDAAAAREAVKRALTLIDELEEERDERKGWSSQGWSPEDQGLWKAHVAARQTAHHTGVAPVSVDATTGRAPAMLWHDDAAEIARLAGRGKRSKAKAQEYAARLAGHPVMPGLRRIAQLVAPLLP